MDQEHDIAVDRAIENYGSYPNVCGVSYGSKFSDGIIDPNRSAVQFFVTSKKPESALKRSLPRFVYARNPDGSLDRSEKIATDVIDLVDLELCCAAGDQIASSGVDGTTTLIFENKANLGQILVLTCSHVVDGLDQSPPAGGRMVGGHDDCLFVAQTLGNTVAKDDVLSFDLAVGEASSVDDGFTELRVAGETTPLSGFGALEDYPLDALLSLSSEVSDLQMISVNSSRTRIEDIDAGGGRSVAAENVFVCTGAVEKGDSGGIVYDGPLAVGVVIARARNDWVLVQPLNEAIDYLAADLSVEIRCF